MRESNFDPEYNDLPMDFDELEMKLRLNTERRQSYYVESTVQSKNCTENSFYFNNHPALANEMPNNQVQNVAAAGNDSSQGGNTHEAIFNNFFSNPGDDVKDIYNDSSGTNNNSANGNAAGSNTGIPNIK